MTETRSELDTKKRQGESTPTVGWSHVHHAYLALVKWKRGQPLWALGESAEEALFKLKAKMEEAKKVSEAWNDE